MKLWRYSRWDGTQAEFRLDARRALDALSNLLMEGLDMREALEWMRRQGFELGGLDMRVMGLDELMDELRQEAQSLYDRYRMDEATEELRRVERLLDLVLEHGRPAPPPRTEAGSDLAAAFDSVVQLVGFRAAERGISLEAAETGTLPPARISEDALRQVVLNLVLNGAQSAGRGGRVVVELRDERTRDRPRGTDIEHPIRLSVGDSGPGIPESDRGRIFDPFYTTRIGGSGLGLAVVHRAVEAHAGATFVGETARRGGRGHGVSRGGDGI